MPLTIDPIKGITVSSWTTATRPSPATAGQMGFNTDLTQLEVYNGTTWVKMG